MNMKKTLTDEEILATADQLNWEKGFDKMRIIDIARQMEVSHTAIYKHFESKELIFEQLLRSRYALYFQDFERAKTAEAFVRKVHAVNAGVFAKNPEHFKSCGQYFKSNLAMNRRYFGIMADFMATETRLAKEVCERLLELTQTFHSPLFLEIWAELDFEKDFPKTWALIDERGR